MGLFDAFSASDESGNFRRGYQLQSNQLNKGRSDVQEGFGSAIDEFRAGGDQALGYLQPAYNTARGDITGAQAAGQNYLTQGTNTAAGIYDQALTPWETLSGSGQQGIDAHWNLINNPDSIYQTELYKNREAAGLDAINRLANSRGMLASGNNTQDILDYQRRGGLDFFNTIAGQYQPYFGLAQNAAAGRSGVLAQKAGMFDQLGRSQAGLAQWGGGQLSDLASQYGVNQANIATGTAGQVGGAYQDKSRLLADMRARQGQAGSDMYMNQANAETAANNNLWSALLGIGGLGAQIYNPTPTAA